MTHVGVSRLVPEAQPIVARATAIRAFYAAVRAYFPEEATIAGALNVIAWGVDFPRAAKRWAEEHHDNLLAEL